MTITAKAGSEYSTMAPVEVRLLGRAKTCGVVTDENEARVQAIASAIMRMESTSAGAAIAEAIQYEAAADKTFQQWAETAIVTIPVMARDYSNLRAVRDAESSNAIVSRVRAIRWQLQIDAELGA